MTEPPRKPASKAIRTPRLRLRPLENADAGAVWQNSLDEDNRRYVPDEVFETLDDAKKTVGWLVKAAQGEDGPYLWSVLIHTGEVIGYVQACRIPMGWEVGYHIGERHTGNGYATEALQAFLPVIMDTLGVNELHGVVLEENVASHRVLQKCGFLLLYRGMGAYQGERRAIRRYCYYRRG